MLKIRIRYPIIIYEKDGSERKSENQKKLAVFYLIRGICLVKDSTP